MDKWNEVPLSGNFFLQKGKVLHLALKINSAPVAAETWHLKGCMLKIKNPVI
jgi:hypothetical protein